MQRKEGPSNRKKNRASATNPVPEPWRLVSAKPVGRRGGSPGERKKKRRRFTWVVETIKTILRGKNEEPLRRNPELRAGRRENCQNRKKRGRTSECLKGADSRGDKGVRSEPERKTPTKEKRRSGFNRGEEKTERVTVRSWKRFAREGEGG